MVTKSCFFTRETQSIDKEFPFRIILQSGTNVNMGTYVISIRYSNDRRTWNAETQLQIDEVV